MEKNKVKEIFTWLVVAGWLVVIFSFSAIKGTGDHAFSWAYFFERKSMHVIEYAILAALFYRAFSQSFAMKKALWFSLACSLLYAVSDEWHQTFVFGREGVIRDVLIDLVGISIAVFFLWKFNKKKNVSDNS